MTQPSGAIYLISRAPVDITYSHTIDFNSPEEQFSYWGSKVVYTLRDYTYVRRERRYINVDMSFEMLESINYLYYRAKQGSKFIFAFVTDREYINDSVTRLYFDIDVMQTYAFDYTWKPTYIAQGHVDRWDANHKPKYSYTDEGLDYGSEYMTESAYKIKPNSKLQHGFYFVFCKEHNELIREGAASEGTTIQGAIIPYDIYIVPTYENDALYQKVEGTPYQYYAFNVRTKDGYLGHVDGSHQAGRGFGGARDLQLLMSKSSFGNFVHQIVYVPYLPFKYEISTSEKYISSIYFPDFSEDDLSFSVLGDEGGQTFALLKLKNLQWSTAGKHFTRELASMGAFEGLENAIPTESMWADLKANPHKTERDRRYESKLLTFPYRYNLFTDWKTTPAVIKNEFLCNEKIVVKESLGYGFNMPRRYYLEKYRKDPEGREASIMQALPMEFPIISDAYYTYMLQNRNQISANLTTAIVNSSYGVVKGAVNGGATGGALGAVTGGLTSYVEGAISVTNHIRAEGAKQQDIKAQPDNLINANDSNYAIADESTYLTFYRKAIACDYAERLAQYWHMFGYIVKAVDIPKTRSRLRYNYIRTVGANIEGNMESNYIAQIKAIFDKGITIWHYNATDFSPLDYTYENPERSLL